jgi:CubicO group peptidase (beta-lactamase class C family)
MTPPLPALLLSALLLLFVQPAAAQTPDSARQQPTLPDTTNVAPDSGAVAAPSPPPVPLPANLPATLTPTHLAAFFDGLLAAQMQAHHISGATVVIVRGDSVLFAKGYGLADRRAHTPVRADATLFRIGSISKTFVWTAVMQLVAQGKLNLDADVNTYLKEFQVPGTYPKPVTLAHLLTHTAGFEDQVIGLFARDPARLLPLDALLKAELPARVRPPGEVASYSNHGTGLAAYIVEQVSGMPFDAYVEKNLLVPLGMEHTTFRQPVPDRLSAGLSKGYAWQGNDFVEQDFEYVPLAPVGAASATATDLARWMQLHLRQGRFGNTVVLDSATALRMQSPLFTPAPGLPALLHGFYEMNRNGVRVFGHGGDTFWFHSLMALLPEQQVGLFVSFNTDGGGAATGGVFEAFMDQYFPADVPRLTTAAAAKDRLAKYAGAWRSTRYSHTTLAKLAATFSTLHVTVTDDGRLKTDSPEVAYWVETGAGVFRKEDGLELLAFREDGDGRPTHLLVGDLPIMALERVGWLEKPGLHLGLAVGCGLVFLLALVGWPLATWSRRRHQYKLEARQSVPPIARYLAWGACLCFVAFLVLFGMSMSSPNEVAYGIPPLLGVALWLPRVAAVLAALALVMLVVTLVRGLGRPAARLWLTLVVLACGLFCWQLWHWNLLAFNF